MDVHAAGLGAAMQSREHLAPVLDLAPVEGALGPLASPGRPSRACRPLLIRPPPSSVWCAGLLHRPAVWLNALKRALVIPPRPARRAYRAYGWGTGHPARLNFGDCFAYALAKDRRKPLLFKGGDFARTDLEAAPT